MQITSDKLRELRKQMGWSMVNAGIFLGISPATYQRYDEGTAIVPDEVAEKMTAAHEKDLQWMKSMVAKINADIDRKFPCGIVSD